MTGRPCSVLVPHVRLRDAHGWIGTQPGCLACVEFYGPDYWRPPDHDPDISAVRPGETPRPGGLT